jgi:Family of unknown function (DUF6444)
MVVPDVPSAPDEAAALRVANARPRQVIEAKDTEVLVLREQLEVLRAEVAELRARLGASSRNSSKPPSADGLGRPVSRSLRGRSGRRPGRPKGQPGATLEMTGAPDEVVPHELCNAHALRELQAVIDASPPGQWCWAGQAADALRQMMHAVHGRRRELLRHPLLPVHRQQARHRHPRRPHPSGHRNGLDPRCGITMGQATYPVTRSPCSNIRHCSIPDG